MIVATGPAIRFFIAGPPVAQPRVKATIRGEHAGVYTPKTADGWKAQVMLAVNARPRFDGPAYLRLEFIFERPKSHFGKHGLLPSAPEFHEVKPDPDNVGKSTMDAMVDAGFLSDDKRTVCFFVTKEWGVRSGCWVTISKPKSLKEAR